MYEGVSTYASPSVGCLTTRKVNILTGRSIVLVADGGGATATAQGGDTRHIPRPRRCATCRGQRLIC